ncbi:hypothetical protein N9996_01790 [Synechococcus sp. AH-603-M21]|nr:hypothetical protein [Synechococcus sp. AH-603-M21]
MIIQKKRYKSDRAFTQSSGKCKDEAGIALVMTMLLGATLLAGVSALMVRQLTARKLVASESYRQLAETAANNGLNQILSELNHDSIDQYRGYLLGLSNTEDTSDSRKNFLWQQINTETSPIFHEICTDTSKGLPDHPAGTNKFWPTDALEEQTLQGSNSIRDDGKEELHSYYRLRSYKNPPKSDQLDNGEAKFIIEGLVKRKGMVEGQYLARARLERSLKVEAAILKKRADDWAVLFAHDYQLGKTTINGNGLITWAVQEGNAETISKDCGTKNLVNRISNKKNSKLQTRIWPVMNQNLQSNSTKTLFELKGNVDRRSAGSEKRIWRIDDTNSYQTGKDNYRINSVCKRSRRGGLLPICERIDDGSDPTLQSDYDSIVTNLQDFYKKPSKYKGWKIVLSQKEFCPGKSGDCHIYIEHLNLETSRVYIENDKRPVILHLTTPSQDSSQFPGSNGTFQLSNTALLCGVNEGKKTCNKKPERLIIVSDHDLKSPNKDTSCSSKTYPLKIAGSSLPHAFLMLRKGSVELTANTKLNGAIWSHNICANNNDLRVTIPSKFMEKMYDMWDWKNKNFAGLGKSISRAIRGSGYDTFQRF